MLTGSCWNKQIDFIQIIKASPCVIVCACIGGVCVRGGFLIELFSNIIRILLSEYRIVFLTEMHIPSTRIFKGTIQVWLSLLLWKKNELCKPSSQHYFITPVWEFRNANAITKFIGVFIAADLRPFSVVDKQAVFFFFPTVPILPYRDFKTKVRTKPWLLCTVTPLLNMRLQHGHFKMFGQMHELCIYN